jgi:carboxypeptidase Q
VAVLVRSVTAYSLYTPHTGALRYDPAVPKIPAAAITVEDAELIARLVKAEQPVTVHLRLSGKTLEDTASANVVGELRGSTNPEEVVVIGGHLDSWDVGHGAHDDGGGCVVAMEAITVLRKLNLIPRRTIRVVLWTNEENGLRGAKAYVEKHKEELANHVAAIESDGGVFHPTGFSVECNDPLCERAASEQLKDIIRVLEPLGPMDIEVGYSGADVGPMRDAGVVLMGHRVEGATYFHLHHSAADTIDKVDPTELSKNVAAMAVMAYVIADMPERLGRQTVEDAAGSK